MCKPNTEPRSRNALCRGNAINVTYSDCVSIALIIHCAVRTRHIVIRLYSIFLHLTNGTICVLIFCSNFV